MASFVTPMPTQMGNPIGMGMKHSNEGTSEDEPINKKLRNEDSLVPEAVYLTRNPVRLIRFIYHFYETSNNDIS